MGEDQSSGLSVRRGSKEESDAAWALAGQLLGTMWQFPEGPREVVRAVPKQERTGDANTAFQYPAVVFNRMDGSGMFQEPVSHFRTRIDPDQGDVEPGGGGADAIVTALKRSKEGPRDE
jgi:hypothetical protein